MDPNQQRALNNCHRDILRDLDIDKQFLLSLYIDNVITEAQSNEIEAETTRRARVSKLMEILPRRGPSCFPTFVNKLRRDYSWIASKLDSEYEKAEKEVPKDINNKLIDVINQHFFPLVYGDDQSSMLPMETHPGHLVNQLSDAVLNLQYRCFRALGISSKDPSTTYMSLPRLIDKKVHSLQNNLNDMKSAMSDEKKKNKPSSIEADKKQSKETAKLRKELDKQKEVNKKLETSLKSKNMKIQSLKGENEALENARKELQNRLQEYEKEMFAYRRGALITEWKM